MYKFNINKIVVNTSEGTKDIVPKTINVFVGPNNSGKSRFLKELRDYLSGDERDINMALLIKKKSFGSLMQLTELRN